MNTTPNSSHYSPFSRLETHTQPPTPDVKAVSKPFFFAGLCPAPRGNPHPSKKLRFLPRIPKCCSYSRRDPNTRSEGESIQHRQQKMKMLGRERCIELRKGGQRALSPIVASP